MFVGIAKQFSEELPLIPIAIGEAIGQSKQIRPNGFDVHQFLWVTKGEGVFSAADDVRILTKGQGLFTRKFVNHSYQSNGGNFDTMWVTFLSGENLLRYYQIDDYMFFDAPNFLNSSTIQLMDFCQKTASKVIRSASGYSWAAEFLEAVFKKSLSRSQKVTLFLEHNCDRPLTLDDIAEHAKTDRFSLCRFYVKDTGETVMQALKGIRMQKAKKLLRYSSYSVEQIGIMCGYESPSYFIKVFREEIKTTPLQYRQEVW